MVQLTGLLMELRLVCSSADLMAIQMVLMMEMDLALQTVMSSGHLMENLMAMSLVHSTDVRMVM